MSGKKTNIIEISELNKWYGDFHALKNINLDIKEGEIIVVCGPSGSGKSTLIRCVNFLEKFQEGSILVSGTELTDFAQKIRKIRSEVSMVFQHFNLFPHLTIVDNLTLAPIWVHNETKQEAREKALKLLDRVGIKDQAEKYPNQLSGGQQQRVAIARALVQDPAFILADEPTGNLDKESGINILNILKDLNNQGKTVIMITHNQEHANTFNKVIELVDGKIVNS
jgi:general L-amino acid transport system ATP-binding protein